MLMGYYLKTPIFVGNFAVDFDPKYKNETIRELSLPNAFERFLPQNWYMLIYCLLRYQIQAKSTYYD